MYNFVQNDVCRKILKGFFKLKMIFVLFCLSSAPSLTSMQLCLRKLFLMSCMKCHFCNGHPPSKQPFSHSERVLSQIASAHLQRSKSPLVPLARHLPRRSWSLSLKERRRFAQHMQIALLNAVLFIFKEPKMSTESTSEKKNRCGTVGR